MGYIKYKPPAGVAHASAREAGRCIPPVSSGKSGGSRAEHWHHPDISAPGPPPARDDTGVCYY